VFAYLRYRARLLLKCEYSNYSNNVELGQLGLGLVVMSTFVPPQITPWSVFQSTGRTIFLDAFVERFINASDDGNNCALRKADSVNALWSVKTLSPLLSEAFQAVSIAYFAKSIGSSTTMMLEAYRRHGQTLSRLQIALFDSEQSRSLGVLVTVILLMCYEV
jgi:hypothetical protein